MNIDGRQTISRRQQALDWKNSLHGYLTFCPQRPIIFFSDAGWSSLAARRAHNPKVVGSNPTPATRQIKGLQRMRALTLFCFLALRNRPPLCNASVTPGIRLRFCPFAIPGGAATEKGSPRIRAARLRIAATLSSERNGRAKKRAKNIVSPATAQSRRRVRGPAFRRGREGDLSCRRGYIGISCTLACLPPLVVACSGSDNPGPSALSNVQPVQKVAYGGAAPAGARISCPPAFTSPVS
jgi:hypothetical protein